MRHTPGPWTIKGPCFGKWDIAGDYAILDAEGKIIAEAYKIVMHNDVRPAETNAHLIAAAPDLLMELKECCTRMERCRSILQDPECGGNPQSNWGMLDTQKARIAIAKAEGGMT